MTKEISASSLWAVPDDEPEDIASIGTSMSKMRLMIGRRIIGRMAIQSVAPDLDLTHLDVIEAVRRCADDGEATVGAIAEAMRIDPSRGSRLVAELVKQNVLRRAVSQVDARRAVVELTPKGWQMIEALQNIKANLIHAILADWPKEDVERFAILFEKFVDRMHAHTRLAGDSGTDG
ncbi:MarR family winged helix-turn-helix transcriptional regulator [Ciceribacter sp. L1K22]|uniref:MarR family winged helix-turn-helix transcriptional regulator n=1 Tax=Ciceribacter sp. L1K22 TaxID=2820275 RepID=UPI001ABE3F40|nr:MarR family winged helix-turn-helix transcriptional regulator [Ciceribacter sp. L1K22]MBO3759260.1 winged helix-turn-helix transcriptional regulator [Ciceribacter sp. L1K22]